jgi:predicted AlkP superfamily pyrophosphatase or phosphodiesterase
MKSPYAVSVRFPRMLRLLAPALLAVLAGTAQAAPPRLVVFLAVDQMRADYIESYGATWKHGLRTLIDRGAFFGNARFPYLETVTCPGHVTLGTGAYPRTHGMILNGWYDRAQGRLVECTADPQSPIVSYGESRATSGDSAANIMVPTLADEMKAQLSPRPRVVSFSFKARSAIGMAGHHPDLVTWYEDGGWVTAKAFSPEPNPVMARLIAKNPIDRLLGAAWEKVLPAAAYKYNDDAPEERPPTSQWSRTFPKTLRYASATVAPTAGTPPAPTSPQKYGLWERSPLPDDSLGRFARGVLSEMKLGKGPGTDFLAVSFSALDNVGHAYGPLSHEVQDVLARLDRVLGELLAALDKQVGREHYVLALSADHGVAVYPERMKADGKDAGRISMRELAEKLNAVAAAELGPGKHVVNVSYTNLYLAPGVLEKLEARPGAIDKARAALQGVAGVAAAYSTRQLRDLSKITDPAQRAAALSHYPARSGDFVVVPRPNWINGSVGTTHGTHHDYDQHVPLVLYGAGIKAGRFDRAASPADIAPTLASLVGVKLSHAEGAVLTEALAPVTAGKSSRSKGRPSPAARPAP